MLTDMLDDLQELAAADSWMDGASCAQTDPEAFFPPDQAGPAWWEGAVRICRTCPVRSRCLDYALVNDIPFGIWGGLTEQQRRRITGPPVAA